LSIVTKIIHFALSKLLESTRRVKQAMTLRRM